MILFFASIIVSVSLLSMIIIYGYVAEKQYKYITQANKSWYNRAKEIFKILDQRTCSLCLSDEGINIHKQVLTKIEQFHTAFLKVENIGIWEHLCARNYHALYGNYEAELESICKDIIIMIHDYCESLNVREESPNI